MLVKIGTPYIASIVIVNEYGIRISDDTPYLTIKNSSLQYWNGISWQTEEFHLFMEFLNNGVYTSEFIPGVAGEYQIHMVSVNYNVIKDVVITAYDPEAASYNWQVNVPYLIKYSPVSIQQSSPVTIISRDIDNKYWDGSSWVDEISEIIMQDIEDSGTYTYKFIPDEIIQYNIKIVTDSNEIGFILKVLAIAEDVPPIAVTDETLQSLDGSNSRCLTDKGLPLSGATITAFLSSTKEIANKTTSNNDGTWAMILKPGKYHFMFEKQGYISVGFERNVF